MAAMQAEVIWLTGASTGIGRALAIELARRGHRVIASARGAEALEQLATEFPNIVPLPFDVADTEALAATRAKLVQISPFLDRVIINAGTCEYLNIRKPDWSLFDRVMKINFSGAVNTVAIALDLLRARPADRAGAAHIVGVVSQATFVPFARAEAYGASKAAMQYFLDALRVDLAKEAIDVTVINPGFIKTPLTDKNDFPMPFLLSSEVAAKRMASAIERRPRQYDFPARLKWSLKLLGFSPYLWNKVFAPRMGH